MSLKRNAIAAVLLVSSFSAGAALADGLSTPNRAAGSEALAEMKLDQGLVETAAFEAGLAKLRSAGVLVGPLCIELKNGCFTQRELAYRSSEYYVAGGFELPRAGLYASAWDTRFPQQAGAERFKAVVRANGVDELLLFHALEYRERLEHAYLRSYAKTHSTQTSWQIDEDGHLGEAP